MTSQLTGTVTLLFTDIEGSTRLIQRLGAEGYGRLLAEHHRLVRAALAAWRGIEIKTDGDAFFCIFGRAADAVAAVVQIQRQLAGGDWSATDRPAVRMGIHTGDIELAGSEYVGIDINRAARIAAAAHGGQVLLSAATEALVAAELPDGVTTLDLGDHRLKDLDLPERIYQLVIAGLRAEFPPIRSISSRLEVLPAETSTFIGRTAVLDRAHRLLAETRLLTLTGPGGTGKTRLALRLARTAADEFRDGVAFVALAAISDPALVAPTIRHALGYGEETERSAEDTLIARLAGREVLLVLDNFEQVLPAAALVARLLSASDSLKVVVTSRAVLHLAGEQELPVPPLALPDASAGFDPAALSQLESIELFVERAHNVRPDFVLTSANAAAVAQICARLDGLPLAIELAASRLRLLPPAALLARLQQSLDLLQSTAADRTDRQRTLRGAISWSYDLLDAGQAALFRRLGIFVGGWRLDDGEAVVTSAGLSVDVLDGIGRLIDSSLVRAGDAADEARYSMLETIREFALDRLAAEDELAAAAAAHARHYAALVREAEPALTGGPLWLDRFDADEANLRSALAWLADHDMEQALTMGGALWRYWQRRGHLREGADELSRLLARPAAQAPTAGRAKALIGLAGVVYWRLDYAEARRCYEEALTLARSLQDERLQAEALYSLTYLQALDDDLAGAQARLDEAAAIYQRLADRDGVASAIMANAMLKSLAGNHEQALELMDAAIEQLRATGNGFALANTLSLKERSLIELGRLDDALSVNREVLVLALEQNDPTALSVALLDAASVEALAGRVERAARLIGAGQRVVADIGGEAPPELIRRVDLRSLLEARLDRPKLAELFAEGRRMSDDAAVAYALEAS
jgi:predicted ATPase/class 3 adenylate cyclase